MKRSYHILKSVATAALLLGTPVVMTGCGGSLIESFTGSEETRNSTINVPRNGSYAIAIPGAVSEPAPDLNTTDPLPPPSVDYSIRTYPQHGSLTFTGGYAIYTPTQNYIGQDSFSFDIYDQYEDKTTIYNFIANVVDGAGTPDIIGEPPTTIRVGQAYSFTPTLINVSDPSTFTFSALGLPSWMSIDPATGALSGTPGASNLGDNYIITLRASATGVDLQMDPFTLTVLEAAATIPPVISGTPTTEIEAEQPYFFAPTVYDPDSPVVTFSISNKPSWMNFDSQTGTIDGVPSASDIGTTNGIVITVWDGTNSAALPAFDLTVLPVGVNVPPNIQGVPSSIAYEGQQYLFTPIATDDNNDPLTFYIANKPSWATFDPATGTLSGIPTASHVGLVTDGVTIYVSDGKSVSSLEPVSITVVSQTP